MAVCFLSYHNDIRSIKQAIALEELGIDILFVHAKSNPSFKHALPNQSFYEMGVNREKSIIHRLRHLGDSIELIHVHSEPEDLVSIARKARPDLKIIYDCHDLDFMRYNITSEAQKSAMKDCDAIIFPSKGYSKGINEEFKVVKDKPQAVVYSMVNNCFIGKPSRPHIGGIVYQGGLTKTDYAKLQKNGEFGERDYIPMISEITKRDYNVFLYSAGAFPAAYYEQAGATVMPTRPYQALMEDLQRYDWGLFGSMFPCKQIENSMPNKLFEYIAAGLPVLVYNCSPESEVVQFIRETNTGVLVSDWDELDFHYSNLMEYKKRAREKRWYLTMEREIVKVLKLYDEVMGKDNE